jgi:hypothetical protein
MACGQAPEPAKPVEKPAAATGQQSAGAGMVKKGADETAEGAKQAARGLQQMAQGFQQMAQGAATPVDFEQLKTFLPEIEGWTRSDLLGRRMNMPVPMSHAEARYRKGESSITIDITDSALNQLVLAPMSMFLATGYEERSDTGYRKATTIGGYPGFEYWEKNDRQAEVTAVVANRFVVVGKGRDVTGTEAVRTAVEAVNLGKLAGLK